MTSSEAMEIGMRIAERHEKNVMELAEKFGATTKVALHGCVVSLAAEIMQELQAAADGGTTL